MPSPLPHLIVRRTAARQTPLTPTRNIAAIRSALLRGDRVVTLHNTSRILREHARNIRVPYHPRHMQHDQLFEWPFGDQYQDSRSSHSAQPQQVGEFIELLEWDGFRLEWIRVLGQGGFGMATLWHVIFEDQSSIKVVIKIPVRANADFDSELDWHLRYGGASHVTQALDIQAMADSVRRRINRGHMINRGARFVQTNMDVLVLEYAERGSLYDMMAKTSYFGIRFSDKVLWEIWECLVKGVVSTAFQPDAARRWGPDGLDKVLDSLDDVRNMNELLRICTLIDSHDVHFDLEEQNILISEDAQHSHHPIFKLHDFGDFSHRMQECWQHWEEGDYWKVRRCPKSNRIPPETISKEWDKIDLSNPGPVSRFTGEVFDAQHNEVAGRYGTWTNIFTIAKIMEAVITRNWVGHPMTTMSYTAQDRRCTGNSYGWRICRQSHAYIEAELLDLIMQCQFEKPANRPKLSYLLRKICDRKHRGFQELDHETRGFWDSFWALTKTTPVPLSQGPIVEIPGPGNNDLLAAQATNHNMPPSSYTQTVAALRPKSHRSPLSDSSTYSAPYPRPQTAFGHRSQAEGTCPAVAALRRKSHRSPLSDSSTDSPTGLHPQPALTHATRAARTNPAVMTRVPSLRRKSHRSPLSMSSTGSSILFSHQRPSMFGQTGAGPAANPPLSALGTPVRETNQQRRSSKSTSSDRRDAKKQKRVQFGRSAQTTMTSGGNAMDISMGDDPESVSVASMMDLDGDEGEGEAMDEDEEDELMGEDSW
ncbi:uncharacterized protein Triagg1_9183 [Trichoderma aggressivum f. europaeum]|uniref:Protein kinase domain-containing protein n=1 Tax=Trichoderma aggressivum f. europaeum TaxID=173218 RepID=A0AAE1M0Y9_9HYPO|nr:hypothetical protein Triagg1_9183 [Trichoderma aggressivum f. europaeum]